VFSARVALLAIPRRHRSGVRQVVVRSAHQTGAVVSIYLFVLAGLSFLVFLVKLRSRRLS